jgi:hypothetical protein
MTFMESRLISTLATRTSRGLLVTSLLLRALFRRYHVYIDLLILYLLRRALLLLAGAAQHVRVTQFRASAPRSFLSPADPDVTADQCRGDRGVNRATSRRLTITEFWLLLKRSVVVILAYLSWQLGFKK